MNPTVYVMMSAFNGEKYIREQLDSILNQKYVDVMIVVRDDGSKDGTLHVLREYEEKCSNIMVCDGENVGYAASFWTLLKDAPDNYDYYAFSDQDDVWEPEKLAAGIYALKQRNEKLKLYASALNVTDENLCFKYKNEFKRLKPQFGSAITRPRISGCTMIFNRELLAICKKMDIRKENGRCMTHDSTVYLTFLACGGRLAFSKKSYISLRRHHSTVTGHGKGILKRASSVLDIFITRRNEAQRQTAFLFDSLCDDMTEENLSLCHDIMNYRSSFFSTLRLCFDRRIKCNLASIDIVNIFAVLFHCY